MRQALEGWFALPVPRFFLLGLIAVLLGLLIGIERERHRIAEKGDFWAGVRTFALFTLLGFLAGELGQAVGVAVLLVAFGGFAALIVTAYVVTGQRGGTGITTEAAALVAFLVGALVSSDLVLQAAGTAIVTAILLSMKTRLHEMARAIEDRDITAALKFATLAVILLPVLPDESFGLYDAINPFRIGLLVVILSGVSFAGYILTKALGSDRGITLTGLVGGLVSSTAVTVSMARRSRERAAPGALLAGAALLACLVMLPRMFLLGVALAPELGPVLAGPLAGMAVAGVVFWFALRKTTSGKAEGQIALGNPFDLGETLRFAAVFFVVLFAARWARTELGDAGLLVVAAISGIADVDPVTVSVASEVPKGLPVVFATLALALAAMVNTIFKGAIGWWYGSPDFRRAWVPACAAMMIGAAVGCAAAWALASP